MSEATSGTPKLNAALAKAQGAMRTAKKDSVNPHFKSKYADAGEVWSVWQEVGPAHGLAVLQRPMDAAPGFLRMGLTLLHESGEERDCGAVTMKLGQDTPQGYGSAMTYAGRYLMKALGITSDEDDDGNAASAPSTKPKPVSVKAAPVAGKTGAESLVSPAPDDLEREKAALRAAFAAASNVTALDALWTRVKALPTVDVAELTVDFKARKTALRGVAA
jgi:hypothetical protein